jgi:hypothetical protein
MLEKAKAVVPGTQQVQIAPLVTMGMVIITYLVTEYTAFKAPEEVWGAITGLTIYGFQYWHGPR